jgi:sirohydrochlorin cobaltochelatase
MGAKWVPGDLFSMRGDNPVMSDARTHALILFAHGARDARWAQTLHALRTAVLARRPRSRVELAFLEFQSPTLGDALADAVAAGCTRIDIAPVFWASGGHIVNDPPPLLDAFRRSAPHVRLNVLPVLSELPGMTDFIANALNALAGDAT